jgi:hypothetical protein
MGKIRNLPGVMNILDLIRSLIFLSKLDDASVDTLLGKGTCKMARGLMVLMWGVHCGTIYMLLGSSYTGGCINNFVFPEQINKEDTIHIVPGKNTMLWHQRLGHIGEKGLQTLHDKGMVEGISNCTLDFDLCEHCIYGKKN